MPWVPQPDRAPTPSLRSGNDGGLPPVTPQAIRIPGRPGASVELPSAQLSAARSGLGAGGLGNVHGVRGSTLEALWTDRFAVSASSWSCAVRCWERSSGSPSAWSLRPPRHPGQVRRLRGRRCWPRARPAANPHDPSRPATRIQPTAAPRPVDRPNPGEHKAGKHRDGGGDKASRGIGKPGKGKNK
jgi:hypothetical protein